MTQVNAKLRVNNFSVNIVEQKEFVESDKISYSKWIEADNKMKMFMLGYMIDSLIA